MRRTNEGGLANPQPASIMATESHFFESFKDGAEGIAACFTILGIAVGGVLFLLRRQRYPRANLKHWVEHYLLPNVISPGNNLRFVRVTIAVENKGEVQIKLHHGTVRVQQVLPVDPGIAVKLPNITELLAEKGRQATKIPWPILPNCRRDYSPKTPCEIEPGETQELYFDFLIEPTVRVVVIYSYLFNQKKLFKAVGWTATSTYDFLTLTKEQQMSQQEFDDDRPHVFHVDEQEELEPIPEPIKPTEVSNLYRRQEEVEPIPDPTTTKSPEK